MDCVLIPSAKNGRESKLFRSLMGMKLSRQEIKEVYALAMTSAKDNFELDENGEPVLQEKDVDALKMLMKANRTLEAFNKRPGINTVFQASNNTLNEALPRIFNNPQFGEFVLGKIRSAYPNVKIFTDINEFKSYVEKVGGKMDLESMNAIGNAFYDAVFIDPARMKQDTFLHEHTHLYVSALPEDSKIKKELIDFFGSEENAVVAITDLGMGIIEDEYFNKSEFRRLVMKFWAEIKALFSSKQRIKNLAMQMADDIINNANKFDSKDFRDISIRNQSEEKNTNQDLINMVYSDYYDTNDILRKYTEAPEKSPELYRYEQQRWKEYKKLNNINENERDIPVHLRAQFNKDFYRGFKTDRMKAMEKLNKEMYDLQKSFINELIELNEKVGDDKNYDFDGDEMQNQEKKDEVLKALNEKLLNFIDENDLMTRRSFESFIAKAYDTIFQRGYKTSLKKVYADEESTIGGVIQCFLESKINSLHNDPTIQFPINSKIISFKLFDYNETVEKTKGSDKYEFETDKTGNTVLEKEYGTMRFPVNHMKSNIKDKEATAAAMMLRFTPGDNVERIIIPLVADYSIMDNEEGLPEVVITGVRDMDNINIHIEQRHHEFANALINEQKKKEQDFNESIKKLGLKDNTLEKNRRVIDAEITAIKNICEFINEPLTRRNAILGKFRHFSAHFEGREKALKTYNLKEIYGKSYEAIKDLSPGDIPLMQAILFDKYDEIVSDKKNANAIRQIYDIFHKIYSQSGLNIEGYELKARDLQNFEDNYNKLVLLTREIEKLDNMDVVTPVLTYLENNLTIHMLSKKANQELDPNYKGVRYSLILLGELAKYHKIRVSEYKDYISNDPNREEKESDENKQDFFSNNPRFAKFYASFIHPDDIGFNQPLVQLFEKERAFGKFEYLDREREIELFLKKHIDNIQPEDFSMIIKVAKPYYRTSGIHNANNYFGIKNKLNDNSESVEQIFLNSDEIQELISRETDSVKIMKLKKLHDFMVDYEKILKGDINNGVEGLDPQFDNTTMIVPSHFVNRNEFLQTLQKQIIDHGGKTSENITKLLKLRKLHGLLNVDPNDGMWIKVNEKRVERGNIEGTNEKDMSVYYVLDENGNNKTTLGNLKRSLINNFEIITNGKVNDENVDFIIEEIIKAKRKANRIREGKEPNANGQIVDKNIDRPNFHIHGSNLVTLNTTNMFQRIEIYMKSMAKVRQAQNIMPFANFVRGVYSTNDNKRHFSKNQVATPITEAYLDNIVRHEILHQDIDFLSGKFKKSLNRLNAITGFSGMSNSLKAPIRNVFQGTISSMIWGPMFMEKNIGEQKYHIDGNVLQQIKKLQNMMKVLNIGQVTKELTESEFAFMNTVNKIFMLTTSTSEKFNYWLLLHGAIGEKINDYDINGELIPGKEGLSKEEKLELKIIANYAQGNYQSDRPSYSYYVLGRTFLLFKGGWLIRSLKNNWGREHIDLLGKLHQPTFLLPLLKSYHRIKDGKWPEMDEQERNEFRRSVVLYSLAVLFTATYLSTEKMLEALTCEHFNDDGECDKKKMPHEMEDDKYLIDALTVINNASKIGLSSLVEVVFAAQLILGNIWGYNSQGLGAGFSLIRNASGDLWDFLTTIYSHANLELEPTIEHKEGENKYAREFLKNTPAKIYYEFRSIIRYLKDAEEYEAVHVKANKMAVSLLRMAAKKDYNGDIVQLPGYKEKLDILTDKLEEVIYNDPTIEVLEDLKSDRKEFYDDLLYLSYQ